MRWLFVLLLLANAVLFVWQNRSVSPREVAEAVPQGVTQIRLLGEIDASLLLSRNNGGLAARATDGDVGLQEGLASAPPLADVESPEQ